MLTSIAPSMFSSSSIVYVQVCPAPQIFSKQQMSPFELSSCCSCHVFSYYFAQFLLLKRVKCPPYFVFTTKTQLGVSKHWNCEFWLLQRFEFINFCLFKQWNCEFQLFQTLESLILAFPNNGNRNFAYSNHWNSYCWLFQRLEL